MDKFNQKILVTGGHLTPAIAVVTELKKRGYSNFVWIGHKYNQASTKTPSAEFNTVTNSSIPFYNLKTGKLIRDWSFSTFIYGIKNLFWILLGFINSLRIILKERPRLILSFGGYLALPVVITGKLLGARIVTHEQTIVTGLANKIISKFANKVLISWESSFKYFNAAKTIFTGNPIRSEVFEVTNDNLVENLNPDLPTLLIYGGNQGAHEINKRIFDILEDLLNDFNIIHQTGSSSVTKDNERAIHIKASLTEEQKIRYVPVSYISSDQVGAVLDKADIVIGRAGANTIAELLALGKLSILIPIPQTSHDEQINNAKFVEKAGLALYLDQNKLTPERLYQSILLVRNQLNSKTALNNKNLSEVKKQAKELVKLNAAELVADQVESLL
ncbi:UDP-N-acetylglucosamine--N-acetylmuramyl-(pentapeptide) pyrophosphoryl-undecaprenol N-acetylglucosamine transferase [Patescibacteria group bacterium]|nr:UDP-N-acetylglucosamine--N-acetylmuramyl-(pentapeptide) pyrophosphoryl-undecaprenol N-acetylglucosamine transferase [Patescibacteria group bacterium]